jgi:hypothetical protein
MGVLTGALLSTVQQYRHGVLGGGVGTMNMLNSQKHTTHILRAILGSNALPNVHFSSLWRVRTCT